MAEVQIAIVDQQEAQIVVAVPGLQGASGAGVASGGTTGQSLIKASNGDYDTVWATVSGITNLSYSGDTRTINSSTGSGTTLPLFASGLAGLVPSASGGTTSFLREDGTWQEVVGATNLSYSGDTRTINSSTGSGATLPIFASGIAGLVPSASGGTTLFLREDGEWSTAGSPVAGASGSIQYNNGASPSGLAASSDLTWDDTGKVLEIGGDINLDDGGTYETTLQVVTPTAARTISFPDATGTVALVAGSTTEAAYSSLQGGFTGAVPFVWDNALSVDNGIGFDPSTGILSVRGGFTTNGAVSALGTTSIPTLTGNTTFTGRVICSVNSAGNAASGLFSGNWFTTGTSTTSKATLLVEQTGATSTGWNPTGTGLGVNSASTFAGRLLDLQQNGTSRFNVDAAGVLSFTQPAPAEIDATATLTAANIRGGIITSDTTAAAVDLTLPTGTDMDTAFSGAYVNQAVMWSVINTGTNAAELLAGTDHTIVGGAVVAAGTSGRFATRRTAANTWVVYRLS
jgi:hypothetical protein